MVIHYFVASRWYSSMQLLSTIRMVRWSHCQFGSKSESRTSNWFVIVDLGLDVWIVDCRGRFS